ncbi:MATE family efflux transporter [Siminovitchia fortis]|nr:hypothetical protein [Siminovitchia fortis]
MLVILIVPKLVGIKEYGYWQVYLFYSSYVGFLHFGWNDGIYLRYGGKKYSALDKNLFFSQFYMLLIFQAILAFFMIVLSILFTTDINKKFIFQMIAFGMIIVNVRFMLIYILQGTNRIKEFAQIIMLDRIIYCFLIVLVLLIDIKNYKWLILADLVGKFISLIFGMYCCKDMVFRNIKGYYFSYRETMANINVGMKLMFANIASMMNIGIVRFGIERSWSVSTFGKVSLTLSVANLMMLFINALGVILFPVLRRANKDRLPYIYITIRDPLMVVLLGTLLLYYPLKTMLVKWLPQYSDSLIYMALLFPMCIFEGKLALLINTYLKALRKEKLMLNINLLSLIFALFLTLLTCIVLKNLDLAVVSIVVIVVFKCIISEIYLSKVLNISIHKDLICEILMTLIFILTGWFINSWFTVLLYAVAYLLYLFIKRNNIITSAKNIQTLMRAK